MTNQSVRLNHSNSHRKIIVNLTFVDNEVKSNLHINISRAKTVSVHHK